MRQPTWALRVWPRKLFPATRLPTITGCDSPGEDPTESHRKLRLLYMDLKTEYVAKEPTQPATNNIDRIATHSHQVLNTHGLT